MNAKKIIAASLVAAGGLALTSCATDADVVSKNISKAADQFEIGRRVREGEQRGTMRRVQPHT